MNTPKRSRSSNFNKEEELMLLEEVGKYKNIIECKTTNKISNNEKEEAWQKILISLNARNITARTIDQIKSKYDNLKSKVRKQVAQKRTYVKGTGGGPAAIGELDAVSEAVIELMNLKTVVGLESKFDSDAISYNVLSPQDLKTEYSSIHNLDVLSVPLDHCYNAIQNPIEEGEVMEIEVQPTTTNPHIQQSLCISPVINLIEQEPKGDWSNYVPEKLKRKVNRKLRPTLPNPAFHSKAEYYKKKTELLEKAEEREKMLSERRDLREEEEHKKKMVLLDLEIELKKKQLLKL